MLLRSSGLYLCQWWRRNIPTHSLTHPLSPFTLLAVPSVTCPQYEPELVPGLIYRMADPKIVLLIFVSGKVVLTGAKKREDIYRAFESIYPVLQTFRKGGACLRGGGGGGGGRGAGTGGTGGQQECGVSKSG